MENKTSYSQQDAKDEIAINDGWTNWREVIAFCMDKHELDSMFTRAAELYKEKATEELRKEVEALTKKLWDSNEHNKHQASLINMLNPEIERLKESNKELVEALKAAYGGIIDGEIGLDRIVNNIKEAIEKSKP